MASNSQDQMVHCDWLLLGQGFTVGDVIINPPSFIVAYFFYCSHTPGKFKLINEKADKFKLLLNHNFKKQTEYYQNF